MKKRVLIADDDQLVQKTLKFGLEEAGYEVGLAKEGREALCYIEAHRPHFVLLDVFMPEQDGLETLMHVKRRFPATKVFIMSGGGIKNRYEFLAMAAKLGADGTIRKPLSSRDLIALLEDSGDQAISA